MFRSNGAEVGVDLGSNILRFTEEEAEDLSIDPPDFFNGKFTLETRARLVDETTTGDIEVFGVVRFEHQNRTCCQQAELSIDAQRNRL